ncbi:MAG: hypothetical protein Q8N98_02915 [bacterium]|nr:hypothetical protein [bacterium]
MIKCPVRKRLIKEKGFFIKRTLPCPGEILVKEEEWVKKEQLIASANFSPGFHLFNLATELGIKPSEAKKYFKKNLGDRVFRGEILVEKASFFGGKKEIISSQSGIIAGFDEKTGILKINFLPTPVKIAAGADGKIVKIEKETITIGTVCDKIIGVAGSGKGEGILKTVVPPGDFFLPSFINHDLAGAIVAGGNMLLRDTLEKAIALGVAGIICGGIHYRDFLALEEGDDYEESKEFKKTTVVVLEGFGPFPIGNDISEFLRFHEGRYCLIDGNEAFFPLDNSPKDDLKLEDEKKDEAVLKKGNKVIVVAEPYFSKTGKVTDIGAEEEIMESGTASLMVEVRLDEEKKTVRVPWQNLEILEESC